MVETQQDDEEAQPFVDDGYGPYIHDADILDQPELFYGQNPGTVLPKCRVETYQWNIFYKTCGWDFSEYDDDYMQVPQEWACK